MVDTRTARTFAFDGGSRPTAGNAGVSRELIFEVAGHPFAIGLGGVREIVPVPWMACEPGERDGPSVLAGIMNLGGSAVPVLHTARLLDLPDPSIGVHTPVIIVGSGGTPAGERRFGLLVDAVRGIAAVEPDEWVTMPTHSVSTKAVRIDERLVPVVDLDKVLLLQERERIEELRRARQRRIGDAREVCA